MLTVLLGLERLTMKRTAQIFALQLRNLFAKPTHRKVSAPAPVESPVVETSGQSYTYTSSSYTAPNPTANALPDYDFQLLESDVILTFS